MIRRTLLTATLAGVIASGAIGGSIAAYARNNEQATNEATIMANAKITMAQAIAAAEQQVGGKTVGTGIEDQDGTVYFEIQVVKDGARQKVLVDPQSGKIVKTVTADNEHNERGHENDDD
jgi:uncharacterized membrane protein YkoI